MEKEDELNEILLVLEREEDTLALGQMLVVKGQFYSKRFEFAIAMDAFLEALEVLAPFDKPSLEITIMHGLGTIYNYLEDFNNRLKCNLRCLELSEAILDQKSIITSLVNIGDTFTCLKEYEEANDYFDSALKLELTPAQKAILIHNKAEVAFHNKELDLAYGLFIKSLDLSCPAKAFGLAVASYLFLIRISIKKEDLLQAKEWLNKTEELINEHNFHEYKAELYDLYYHLYKEEGQFERALECLELANKFKEEILSDNKIQRIKNVEFSRQMSSINHESKEIKKLNLRLQSSFQELAAKNDELQSSINYAKLIQDIILPSEEMLNQYFKAHYLLYRPKDVLSGDFYWVREKEGKVFVAVADCTGHGIPGALLSILCNNALNAAFVNSRNTSDILNFSRRRIVEQLYKNGNRINDGMDISLICFDPEKNEVDWCGANQNLWILSEEVVTIAKGNKLSICADNLDKRFSHNCFKVNSGDRLILFTDGYVDQFGGLKNKKLKSKPLKEQVLANGDLDVQSQGEQLELFFDQWKNTCDQVDDVTLLLLEIP